MKAQQNRAERPRWDLYRDGITQTQLAEFLTCRERTRLGLREMLSPTGTSDALLFGSIGHHALEGFYKSLVEGMAPDARRRVMTTASREAVHRVVHEEKQDEETAVRLGEIIRVTLLNYADFYEAESLPFSLEEEFSIPWTCSSGRTIMLRGKMDQKLRLGSPKKLWLGEHKFFANVKDMESKIPLDLQVNFYAYALWRIHGERPRGVRYNVVRRTMMTQGKSESFEGFLDRLNEDIRKRPDHYFHRWECPLERRDMDQWRMEFRAILDELDEWYADEGRHYRNTASCMAPYPCKFLPVCSASDLTDFKRREKPFPELSS